MGVESSQRDDDYHIASEAAYRTSRIVEDMLAKDLIQYGQDHLYVPDLPVPSICLLEMSVLPYFLDSL